MLEDLDTIISAVAAVAADTPIIVIADPARARRMKLRMLGRDLGFEILPSAAVGPAELVAIATNCLVSATDPVPSFDSSMHATPVMDTAADDIVSSGIRLRRRRAHCSRLI